MFESMTGSPWDGAALLLFLVTCAAGGWFLVRAGFRLSSREEILVGAGVGMSLATWLANALSRWIAPPASFWLAALIPLGAGLALWWRERNLPPALPRGRPPWLLLAAVLVLTFVFFRIGRGLSIFDDRKNLSMISILAAGDIPPHFYMNPDFYFSYHYGFQLLGGMLMRVGELFPWTAFDLAKGMAGGLAVGLSVLWGRRVTGRWAGGAVLGMVVLFASGARWLLLLLPRQLVSQASQSLALWGSAAQTASDLPHALASAWVIEGGPPFPLPFAFVNGILQPLVLYLQAGPVSLGLILLLLTLLLYPARARRWTWGLLAILLAMWALVAEAEFVLLAMGLAGACVVVLARRWRSPDRSEAISILVVLAVASAAALIQGGTLTEVARRFVAGPAEAGEGVAGFTLRAAPAIVSSHLGELRLNRAGELLIGLLEIGAPLLLLPVAVGVTWRAVRRGRIVTLGLGIGTLLGFLIPIFTRYQVDRDITRLTHFALTGWILLSAAPVAAAWLAGGGARRGAITAAAALLVFGGVVVTGPLLTALPGEALSSDIRPVDAAMARSVWNRLPPRSLVIDSVSWRAVALTGRLTRSAQDSSTLLESWQELVTNPVVGHLRAAGFDYAYVDLFWWRNMRGEARESFQDACVRLVAEQHDNGANGDRWLYDLRACRAD